ncbi:four helix bundle protein [Sphingobacterium wenxiniae]|uniref:Four helix bundle protein n=1 Tax=Sphingobacterium wenxiniae TaxID=683125 RepID=A0A1I6NYJ3_9SPHI|nr:four helix bundle protein [Sphingobacterium wenxiniae]SFS33023.1 four helix bundle protein [Sphingobacterium wenxiniae]
MKENNIKDKSFAFAVRVVRLYQHVTEQKREYILSKQILRSGTSVGAMIREAEHGQSKADFIHKFAIAQKEINETIYWLELLKATDYINESQFNSLNIDAVELIKIITTIIKTTKRNLNTNN